MKNKYYNWRRAFSYNALFNIIITPRSRGKTYGFIISRILQTYYNNKKTVMLTKFKNELEGANSYQKGIYNTIINDIMFNDEINEIVKIRDKLKFELKENHIYLNDKICMSFYAISMAEKVKKITALKEYDFLAHDECITFGRYVKNEIDMLLTIYDTMNRRKPLNKSVKLYLLGNALTKYNPYFESFGFENLHSGYNYIKDRKWLIHIEDDKAYSKEREKSAVSMLADKTSKYLQMANNNAFVYDESDFLAPNIEKFNTHYFMLYLNGNTYTFSSIKNGYYLHTKRKANKIYHVLRPSEETTKLSRQRFNYIKELYHNGLVYFENIKIKSDFEKDFFRSF